MGAYITKSDIESIFGIFNVLQWSNLDNADQVADDDRIDDAIAYSEQYVEDRMRDSIYAVPLVGNSSTALLVLKHHMAALAGVWLYETRGAIEDDTITAKMELHRNRADQVIDRYLNRSMKLDAARATTGPSAPVNV